MERALRTRRDEPAADVVTRRGTSAQGLLEVRRRSDVQPTGPLPGLGRTRGERAFQRRAVVPEVGPSFVVHGTAARGRTDSITPRLGGRSSCISRAGDGEPHPTDVHHEHVDPGPRRSPQLAGQDGVPGDPDGGGRVAGTAEGEPTTSPTIGRDSGGPCRAGVATISSSGLSGRSAGCPLARREASYAVGPEASAPYVVVTTVSTERQAAGGRPCRGCRRADRA